MATAPPIHHWLGGDEVNASRLNEIKTSVDFLRNPPMARIKRENTNFTFSAASGTFFTVTFDTLANSYDPYGMWDAGDPDHLTIQVPGWYSCEMVVAWAGTAQDLRYIQVLAKNGMSFDDMILRHDQASLPNSTTVIRKEGMLYLNQGDDIYLGVSTEGTGTFTVNGNTNNSEGVQMRVRWISN